MGKGTEWWSGVDKGKKNKKVGLEKTECTAHMHEIVK